MTITVLKSEFIKSDHIQISYRDYKNYDPLTFGQELRNNLYSQTCYHNEYNEFQTCLREVLDKHAPIKKKYLRANDSPFMNKQLRKLIMNRSRYNNIYFKNKTADNWENYRLIRNQCVKLVKKVKREYYENRNLKFLKDNRTFWKTIKPFMTNKGNNNEKIILIENDEIVSENTEVAEIMNKHFVIIVKEPSTSSHQTILNKSMDSTDDIIIKYKDHPSIIKIDNNVSTV